MSRAHYPTVMPVSKATLPFTQFQAETQCMVTELVSPEGYWAVSNSTELQWQDRALVSVAAEMSLPVVGERL